MSSTAKCVEMLIAEMEGNLSPSFNKLIMGDREKWKRVNKFHYRDGVRRYFYLLESCLIATVDERKPTPEELKEIDVRTKEIEDMLTEAGRLDEMPDIDKDPMMVKIMIRPPMLWEHNMLQNVRPEDSWVQEELGEIWEEYYDFCYLEAAKGSEPQQYTFEVGSEDGGWIFFSPIKCDDFDQHLTGDLDPILPEWLVKSGEVMECTYGIDEHPLWTMNVSDNVLDAIKKELSELGFTEQVNNYAQCL